MPAGLVAYHADIRALVAKVPAVDREIIRDFLTRATQVAARATDQLRG